MFCQTIGPNCSGKTEFVKSLGEDVKEFSNDNIHGLYERIPIGLAAAVWSDKITGDVIQALKNQKSTGKPLMERLKEQKESELVYLTLYYARLMTLEELTSKLKKILPTAEYFDAFMEVIVDIKLMMVRCAFLWYHLAEIWFVVEIKDHRCFYSGGC